LQQEFEDRMICREERRRGPTDSRKGTRNKSKGATDERRRRMRGGGKDEREGRRKTR